jgi:antirestriction protein ArdC
MASGYYKQWRMLGAQVRAGERGSPIVFFKEAARESYDEGTGEVSADSYLVARSSWVFNADQVEGWRPRGCRSKARSRSSKKHS